MNDSCNSCGSEDNADAVAETEAPDLGPQAALAGFGSAADAGYFADELQAQFGITANVSLQESYEATTGQSVMAYVLSVSPELADETLPKLRQLVEAAQAGDYEELAGEDSAPAVQDHAAAVQEDETFRVEPEVGATRGGVPSWLFLLVVCAGAAALVISIKQQQGAVAEEEQAAPLTDEQVFLRELLSASPEPWVRDTPDGGRQEVSLDESTATMRFREDTDGDGSFEIDRRIRLQ